MFKLSTDVATTTGTRHARACAGCQDYALSHHFEDFAVAAVSDGCSTGGLTDVGSRLTCLAALKHARASHHLPSREILGSSLRGLAIMLGLAQDDLYATCLVAVADQETVRVCVHGDGVVAARSRVSGVIIRYRFEWSSNMPEYPVYDAAQQKFLDTSGSVLTREVSVLGPDGNEVVPTETTSYAREKAVDALYLSFPTRDVESVALFTDGVSQVGCGWRSRDWREVVSDLMTWKSTAGAFTKRRLRAYVEQQAAEGFAPVDDLSYAVVRVEDDGV